MSDINWNEYGFLDLEDCDLIDEWNRQAKLMFQYMMMLADAEKSAKEVDVELDLVEAELDRDIRQSPDEFGLAKITEPGIKNAMRLTKAWRKAKQRVIDAEHVRDVHKAAVEAIKHRKDALSKRVDLHGQAYYADPKLPKDQDVRSNFDNQQSREAFANMSKKLNKKGK